MTESALKDTVDRLERERDLTALLELLSQQPTGVERHAAAYIKQALARLDWMRQQ